MWSSDDRRGAARVLVGRDGNSYNLEYKHGSISLHSLAVHMSVHAYFVHSIMFACSFSAVCWFVNAFASTLSETKHSFFYLCDKGECAFSTGWMVGRSFGRLRSHRSERGREGRERTDGRTKCRPLFVRGDRGTSCIILFCFFSPPLFANEHLASLGLAFPEEYVTMSGGKRP